MMFSRGDWVTPNLELEDYLIQALEARGLGVIPIFYYSFKDENLGNRGGEEIVRDYFLDPDGRPRIAALIKLTAFLLASRRGTGSDPGTARAGQELLSGLDVPVVQPLTSYYKTAAQWEADPQGLGAEVGWSLALPEFEGVIEPLMVAAGLSHEELGTELIAGRGPIPKRAEHLAERLGPPAAKTPGGAQGGHHPAQQPLRLGGGLGGGRGPPGHLGEHRQNPPNPEAGGICH